MWRNPSGCSSYGVNFLTPSLNTLLLNFFWLYVFSTFRYFFLYLFSNLAFCSFFLFLLLYSVLVTHHTRREWPVFSSINSIQNCHSSAVPLEDIAWSIVLQITTAGTTTRCQLRVIPRFVCASKHSDGVSIGCLRKKYQIVLISRKQFAQACKQHPTLSKCLCKHSVCANCLHAWPALDTNILITYSEKLVQTLPPPQKKKKKKFYGCLQRFRDFIILRFYPINRLTTKYFIGRVTLFLANNYLTEYRITMEFLHNFLEA